MSAYELLLFGHLLFVIAWLGTDVGMQALSLRARRQGPERSVQFMADVEWLGTRVLVPSSLLVLVFGVLLVLEVDAYDFSQAWITLAFVAFLASFVTGAAFLGPESGRIAALAAERGADDPEVRARTARVLLVSRIELVILVALVLDMVLKPGL